MPPTKLKISCTRPVKERQKLMSELCVKLHGQEQNNAHGKHERVTDSDRFLVNTQVQSHALLRRGFGTSVDSSPDPTYERGYGDIRLIPLNVDYLERNISPPITLQKRQSVVQHRKFLASLAR